MEVSIMRKRKLLSCSFCGKKETEVLKLIAGPKVYICDACVAFATRIMEGDSNTDTQTTKPESFFWRRLLALARQLVRSGVTRRMNSEAVAG